MSRHLERGLLLYQQKNYAASEKEFKLAIADDPEDSYSRAMLAACHLAQERNDEALGEVEKAIAMDPEESFAHYIRSSVQVQRGNLSEAKTSIEEAVRMDPFSDYYYGLLSDIYYFSDDLDKALEAAETGLSYNPEEIDCVNSRARALVRLGRAEEAEDSLIDALKRDPTNSFTHTNLAWVMLRRGSIAESMEHFKEGLRLDPNSEWAREGVVESLKSRNPFYFWILKMTMWFSELDPKIRILLIFLFIFIPPIRGLLLITLLLLWFSDQLFNTILRFDSYGKIVLTDDQIRSNNFFLGICFVLALLIGFASFRPVKNENLKPPPKVSMSIEKLASYAGADSQKAYDKQVEKVFRQIKDAGLIRPVYAEVALQDMAKKIEPYKISRITRERVMLNLAYYQIVRKKFDLAIKNLDSILESEPPQLKEGELLTANYLRAIAALKSQDKEEALAYYKKVQASSIEDFSDNDFDYRVLRKWFEKEIDKGKNDKAESSSIH